MSTSDRTPTLGLYTRDPDGFVQHEDGWCEWEYAHNMRIIDFVIAQLQAQVIALGGTLAAGAPSVDSGTF